MPTSLLVKLTKSSFYKLYSQALQSEALTDKDATKILAVAIIFLRSEVENIKKLGYRLVLLYSEKTKDYRPLFDISTNLGLIPVSASAHISNKHNVKPFSFIEELTLAYMETFRSESHYLTEEQVELENFNNSNIDKSYIIIAPTSYGKSGLILSFLAQATGNTCILVPTKSLLAQTKKRIVSLQLNNIKKVVTHPEMYSPADQNIVAVLTQERLIRLLQKNQQLSFDYVFVDEAHNLLEDNERSLLLGSAILILKKRNSNVLFKYLTPFLNDPTNLSMRHASIPLWDQRINEYVKSEKIYWIDLMGDKELKIYDQFINKSLSCTPVKRYDSEEEVLLTNSGKKNIVYFNKPKALEQFSKALVSRLPLVHSDRIAEAIRELSSYIHKDYNLINCMAHGILYHHGSVPENIRLYIESLYSKNKELRYMITTSTLLEGVNLPADRMFLLDNKKGQKKLNQQQFRNLIGRICRFNEIFIPEDPDLTQLMPEIYLIKSKYMSSVSNVDKFLTDTMYIEKPIKETPENVLLNSTEIDSKNEKKKSQVEEYIENLESGTIPNFTRRSVNTEIGQYCFNNNLTEVEILEHEEKMQSDVEVLRLAKLGAINNSNDLFGYIAHLFMPYLRATKGADNIRRFSHSATQKFYSMLLDWRVNNLPYNQMIARTLDHWNYLIDKNMDTLVYVKSWGDTKREGHAEYWTDIRKKNGVERVNLAIVRIKEEMDFLDNILIKYIETINDLGFLESDYYAKLKYGTSDPRKIVFIKAGFSISAANLLTDKYSELLEVDEVNALILPKPNLMEVLRTNHESEIIRLEVTYNLGL